MGLNKEEVITSLRAFKGRRDDLLHEDEFNYHFERFVTFCRKDPLVQTIIEPIHSEVDVDSWWKAAVRFREGTIVFPENSDDELYLRYRILVFVAEDPHKVASFGTAYGHRKRADWENSFRSIIVRPFVEELSHRLGKAADLATPEARAVQAVPLHRIPSENESQIFLSHKSVDKPLVYRYFHALKSAGFNPWLDDSSMPAGVNLEREILQGFERSCAAVFFVTDNFKDEKYLATEVDYAIAQKRQKGEKFAIVTLRYSSAAPVPGLLTPYIYKNIENDLEGFNELLRALPVELGPVRWKSSVA